MIPQRTLRGRPVSILGLGCSSFSSFFDDNDFELHPDDPTVRSWIATIKYAVEEAGICLLDTAPWYGHGISETVVAWALQDMDSSRLIVQTKVGRYEADPALQFDFSYDKTLASAQQSFEKLGRVDVLQLHDPEFAPSLMILLDETIPAMIECQRRGYCEYLGVTGYPLSVQLQILKASQEKFGKHVFAQTLTYGHYNLHDSSLVTSELWKYCRDAPIDVLAAAPLSMGLLTPSPPPEWHPASQDLVEACRSAHEHCEDIVELALLYALSQSEIPCTLLGMRSIEQVKNAVRIAERTRPTLEEALTASEKRSLDVLRDDSSGPFAGVWKSGKYQWDGIAEANKFWKQLPHAKVDKWQI